MCDKQSLRGDFFPGMESTRPLIRLRGKGVGARAQVETASTNFVSVDILLDADETAHIKGLELVEGNFLYTQSLFWHHPTGCLVIGLLDDNLKVTTGILLS